jgi:hypothetical protein
MTKMNAEVGREPLAELLETLQKIQMERVRLGCESMQQRLDAFIVLGSLPVESVEVESENRDELAVDLIQIRDKAAGLKPAYGEIARTGKLTDCHKLDELFEEVCATVTNAVLLWCPDMVDTIDEALR